MNTLKGFGGSRSLLGVREGDTIEELRREARESILMLEAEQMKMSVSRSGSLIRR